MMLNQWQMAYFVEAASRKSLSVPIEIVEVEGLKSLYSNCPDPVHEDWRKPVQS